MVVVESDRYEENYELISSSQCIILNKISAAKNTVFLVKLVPCRCRSQPYKKPPIFLTDKSFYRFEKNEVPDTLNGISVKYEDATIIIPDSTLPWFLNL